MKKNLNLIVLQDKMVFTLCVLLLLMIPAGSAWLLYLTTLPTSSSLSSIWACRIIFTLTGLSLPVLFVINPDRYLVWYRFTPDGLEYHVLFRKKKMIAYSSLPYILHGKYLHGIYWRDYIIFSDRRLKNTELEHINHVTPSATLVKIRYTKNTSDILIAMLPSKYKQVVISIHQKISIEHSRRQFSD